MSGVADIFLKLGVHLWSDETEEINMYWGKREENWNTVTKFINLQPIGVL